MTTEQKKAENKKTRGTAVTKGNGAPVPEGASVIKDERGHTIIRNQVVAKIAGLAVREIEGVHRLVPFGATQSIASVTQLITGTDVRDMGVQVEVGTREAAVEMRIIAAFGASIPAIADAIRRNVTERVGTMTGLQIVSINIDVVDLYFPEEEDEIVEEEHPSLQLK